MKLLGLAVIGASLVAYGHGPWWLVFVWALLLWSVRTSETASRVAVTAPIVVALIGALASWPDLLVTANQFIRLALVGLALHFGLNAVEERRRSGLLLFAAVWLATPTPLGLLGLALGGLGLGGIKQRGVRVVSAPRAAIALGVAAAAVTLLAFALPRPVPWSFARPTPVASANGRAEPAAAPSSRNVVTTTRRADDAPPVLAQNRTGPGLDVLVNVLLCSFALFAFAIAWQTWRVRARRLGAKPHWSDALPVVALVGGLAMLVAWAGLQNRGAAGRASGANAVTNLTTSAVDGARHLPPPWNALFATLGWLGIVGTLLGIVLLTVLTIVILRSRADDEVAKLKADGPDAAAVIPPPLHRVREAYRALLVALEHLGLGRRADETPEELASRVTSAYPGVANDLAVLTSLYEPVRYGGVLTEQDADTAERAARSITARLEEQRDLEQRLKEQHDQHE
ncbi:DUF4129 domain-containing protein [Deinococcus yavapaiensis]|uniref:Uncharacterized protein DUF4129 n=1 Tax=Deinococcus yavapaiensis KR-236 TaxID=694435 RepID=A0A318SA30_9DEIO|nr:DUF4129 domain-containing protein [Deinococcus yavapaiensis]PYE56270.1 uncharacterized protein DUF4129 [Deinococcus yavapaiensis KR-236]